MREGEEIGVLGLLQGIFDENWNDPLLVEPEEDRQWTYGDVLCRAAGFDSWLRSHGFGDGEPVYFAPSNGSLPLAVYLGSFLSGRTVHAIDPSRGEQDIDQMLSIAGGEKLLTDATSVQERDGTVQLTSFGASDISKEDALELVENGDPSTPFLVTFTSGTTGTPKGVVHSFENLVHASVRFGDRFDFGPSDVFYHTLPMGYMAGILNGLLLPMVHGSTITVGPRMSATTAPSFFDTASSTNVNVFWFTPTMLKMLSKMCSGPYDGSTSPIGCVATEPLPETLQSEFESEFDIKLYETYGLSETLFITTEYPEYPDNGEGVGPVLPDVELTVERDGEVSVTSPWTFLGYVDQSEGSTQNHTVHTGDVGEIRGETLHITGRKKNLIVRNGINISPDRIEDVLEENDQIDEAAVVGRTDDDLGEQVIGIVSTVDSLDQKQVQQRVIQQLGSDHRLDRLIEVPSLPTTEEGTLDHEKIDQILKGQF